MRESQTAVKPILDEAQVVLFILSPDALASPPARWAVGYARRKGKAVIPLLYQPVRSAPAEFETLQWLDFRARVDYESAYRSGFDDLLKAISLAQHSSTTKLEASSIFKSRRRRTVTWVLYCGGIVLVLGAGILLGRLLFTTAITVTVPRSVPATPTPSSNAGDAPIWELVVQEGHAGPSTACADSYRDASKQLLGSHVVSTVSVGCLGALSPKETCT